MKDIMCRKYFFSLLHLNDGLHLKFINGKPSRTHAISCVTYRSSKERSSKFEKKTDLLMKIGDLHIGQEEGPVSHLACEEVRGYWS